MIVGSLLLILVAIALLVTGLIQGANAMLVASIAASLLAAVALVVGGRQATADREAARGPNGRGPVSHPRSRANEQFAPPAEERYDEPHEVDLEEGRRPRRVGLREPVGAGVATGAGSTGSALDETALVPPVRDEEYGGRGIPSQGDAGRRRYADDVHDEADLDDDDDDEDFEDDPDDEPAAQQISPDDAARVARMTAEVLVCDGRPRYHLRGCVHLLGRESEPLPVGEAVELGFTPCGVCEPDSALLADARRV